MTGPYGTAAVTYWSAGWHAPLPLPPRKKALPPSGYTGAAGAWPSYADVYAWAEDKADGNIGLRMPPNVIGIDVDAYGDKLGAQTLAIHEGMYGPLPATWRSSSRDDGVSGIGLFRVPEGLAWPGELTGGGVEIIQTRHRYAVVWPSEHPAGGTYRWINSDGLVSTALPDPDALPMLPDEWVTGLTAGTLAVDVSRNPVGYGEALAWVTVQTGAEKSMCTRMQAACDDAVSALSTGGDGHPVGRDAALRIVRLAEESHPGALAALGTVRGAFLENVCDPGRVFLGKSIRTADEGAWEWSELVASAVGLVSANPTGMATCDCDGMLSMALVGTQIKQFTHDVAANLDDRGSEQAADGTVTVPAVEVPAEVAAANPLVEAFARHTVGGAEFLLNIPRQIPTLWGDGEDVIWAEGESLMLVGPPGVGKTTLTAQIVRGLVGLQSTVLGQPVRPARRVLYLAMDRPQQIRRALARTFSGDDAAVLSDRLVFWVGPPPGDVAKNPGVLLALAQAADADVVVIDSVKDAAIGLTDDEVAAGYNRARQMLVAEGVDLLELHHMVKRGVGGSKPTELADVYGSAWLTAGAGSALLLWGAAGDAVVELKHLKQPMGEFGPLKLLHDHGRGVTGIYHHMDILATVRSAGQAGVTPKDVARQWFGTETPTDSQVVRARGKLSDLADGGHLVREDRTGAPGKPLSVYRAVDNSNESNESPNEPDDGVLVGGGQTNQTNRDDVSAGQTPKGSNEPNEPGEQTNRVPPSNGGHVVPPPSPTPPEGKTVDCNRCGRDVRIGIAEATRGLCPSCFTKADG